ncbi:fimbrial protein [Paraburkholderia sp. DHOC27]|uniref:fimbrial protein n=1 Tax=Paraburkholderia sp. DHOC27 TaxID=2303330 RepID=UPI000E3D6906|nr:fimbrial protein [Paraburkholderia sp. DHOC27]RFU48728.1 fimbrial protein [Paraburkholderia sp. DHOC27]
MVKSILAMIRYRAAETWFRSVTARTRHDGLVCWLTRVFLRYALVLFGGLMSLSAHAKIECYSLSGYNQVLAVGSISVPANATVGTVVTTLAPITYSEQCRFVNGSPNPTETTGTNTANFSTTSPLGFGTDVYQTAVPGLGIRYIFNSSQCSATNVTMTNGTAAVPCVFNGPVGGAFMPASMTVTAQLVVTGHIQGGISTLNTAPEVMITFVNSDSPTAWGQGWLYTGNATGTITQATCSVNQQGVAVSLPGVGTGALSSGVGATAGATSFSLSFSCSPGAKVYITLTDNVNPANQSNTLKLTADSTAQGVGVQVLNSGSPVSFGPDSSTVGNKNQWLIGSSPSGPLQVPLVARYISTGKVSAGTVRALATFTMAYQ